MATILSPKGQGQSHEVLGLSSACGSHCNNFSDCNSARTHVFA